MRATLTQIGSEVYNIPSNQLARAVHQIFSRLINTLVLEMMKQPDMVEHTDDYDYYESDDDFDLHDKKKNDEQRMNKSSSIAYFEVAGNRC